MAGLKFNVIPFSREDVATSYLLERFVVQGDLEISEKRAQFGTDGFERHVNKTVSFKGLGGKKAVIDLSQDTSFTPQNWLNIRIGRIVGSVAGRNRVDFDFGDFHFLLSRNSVVERVSYGDWNKDGLTDVLVRMNTGGSYLFEQRREIIPMPSAMTAASVLVFTEAEVAPPSLTCVTKSFGRGECY